MRDVSDTRILKLPVWAQTLLTTKDRRIEHLESVIKDYEGEGKTRISYNYGHGPKEDDRFLPENVHIEWILKSGRIVRIHERMEGNLAISTDGQLTILPTSSNWIEIP